MYLPTLGCIAYRKKKKQLCLVFAFEIEHPDLFQETAVSTVLFQKNNCLLQVAVSADLTHETNLWTDEIFSP